MKIDEPDLRSCPRLTANFLPLRKMFALWTPLPGATWSLLRTRGPRALPSCVAQRQRVDLGESFILTLFTWLEAITLGPTSADKAAVTGYLLLALGLVSFSFSRALR